MQPDHQETERPLFRSEVREAQSLQWAGSVRIRTSAFDWVSRLGGLIIILAIAGVAFFGSYTRRAVVPGVTEPAGGSIRIMAPYTGTVESIETAEGAHLTRGDSIATITGERMTTTGGVEARLDATYRLRVAELEKRRHTAGNRLRQLTNSASSRLLAIEDELKALAQESAVVDHRTGLVDEQLARLITLKGTGYVATATVQMKEDDRLALEGQKHTLERTRSSLNRERAMTFSQRDEAGAQYQGEIVEIVKMETALQEELIQADARKKTIIVAPSEGTLTGLAAHKGQSVVAGALIATLIPLEVPTEVSLYVATKQAGFVESGQRVKVRLATYPYQKFGALNGVVTTIEKSPYAMQDQPPEVKALFSNQPNANEAVYRVRATLDSQTINIYGREENLRNGLVVEADILLDNRYLYEWILEPIESFKARSF